MVSMSCSKDDLHNTNCNQSGFLPFSPYSVYFLQDCSMFHCHRLQEEQEIVAIKDNVSIFFGTEILPALVTAKSCGPLTVVCMCKIEKESGLFLEIIVC